MDPIIFHLNCQDAAYAAEAKRMAAAKAAYDAFTPEQKRKESSRRMTTLAALFGVAYGYGSVAQR